MNSSDDDPGKCPEGCAEDSGWYPHLDYGEPRSRWVGMKAEDQPHETAEHDGSR